MVILEAIYYIISINRIIFSLENYHIGLIEIMKSYGGNHRNHMGII